MLLLCSSLKVLKLHISPRVLYCTIYQHKHNTYLSFDDASIYKRCSLVSFIIIILFENHLEWNVTGTLCCCEPARNMIFNFQSCLNQLWRICGQFGVHVGTVSGTWWEKVIINTFMKLYNHLLNNAQALQHTCIFHLHTPEWQQYMYETIISCKRAVNSVADTSRILGVRT